jgi:ubiquitin-like-conjugating enzyme ATG3
LDALRNPGEIADIPDLDGVGDVSHGMGGLSLGGTGKEREVSEIPDLDDIPDMEEDFLEDEDEATAAPKSRVAAAASATTAATTKNTAGTSTDKSGVIDARYVQSFFFPF